MNVTSMWFNHSVAHPDPETEKAATARQEVLTKPLGALGKLEQTAIRLAALQHTERPSLEHIFITIFAADHGVASEGVSAYPQEVTIEMVKNFSNGGAAICVLARELDAVLEVINLGTVIDSGPLPGVQNLHLGAGTANLCQQPAMTEEQLLGALDAGLQAVNRARSAGSQLFIGGEMGIGNTTSASALACAFLNAPATKLAGPGTGLDECGVMHKITIIERALDYHKDHLGSPVEILRRLGGFEIAALSGSYIACAQLGLPVLIDGFISSVAALAAAQICPGCETWFLYSHTSAEPGHKMVLNALQAKPYLDIGMRLGEGSGAATVAPLLRLACKLHNEMATFAEAGVADKAP